MSALAADAWVEVCRHDNPLIERSALLWPTRPLLRRQMSRLVKEAKNASRCAFPDPTARYGWLSPVLDRQEDRHLQDFLATART